MPWATFRVADNPDRIASRNRISEHYGVGRDLSFRVRVNRLTSRGPMIKRQPVVGGALDVSN